MWVTTAVSPERPRTYVYVDGFNFYYRTVKHGPFGDMRWLDVVAFCEALLPRNEVVLVRYFTADLRPLAGDRGPADRQQVYLRALRTLPRLALHKGRFAVRQIVRPLVAPGQAAGHRSPMVRVWDLEEKGSDVNLATHLLRDGFHGEYDVAVIVSDDSDLVEPIRVVRRDLEKPVGIVQLRRRSAFVREGDFRVRPRRAHFELSQLPEFVLTADGGVVRKPASWRD